MKWLKFFIGAPLLRSVKFTTQTQIWYGSSKIKKKTLLLGVQKGKQKTLRWRKNWEQKKDSKVQIFTGGLCWGVSENQNVETLLGGIVATMEKGKTLMRRNPKTLENI